jgi:hypothetical protein
MEWRVLPRGGGELRVRFVVYALSGVFGFVGFMFLVGNQGLTRRLLIGAMLMATALVSALLATLRTSSRPSAAAPRQQPETAPPLDLPTMLGQCKRCSATLPQDAYQTTAGSRSVLCPSCGTFYRLEEDST